MSRRRPEARAPRMPRAAATGAACVLAAVAAGLLVDGDAALGALAGIEAQSSEAALVYVAVLTIAALTGLIPASLVAAFGGAAFGVRLGFALSATALLAAAVAGFVATRAVGGQRVRQWVERRFALEAFDETIRRNGFKVAFCLRASPVAPFGVTSVALAMTSISFAKYLVATAASLPALFCFTLAGAAAREGAAAALAGEATRQPWLIYAVLAASLVSFAAMLAIFRKDLAARFGPAAARRRPAAGP